MGAFLKFAQIYKINRFMVGVRCESKECGKYCLQKSRLMNRLFNIKNLSFILYRVPLKCF